jgi:hypothetical protein
MNEIFHNSFLGMTKLVQGERNAKSQRENIEGKFIFTLLSEEETQ